MTGRDDTRMSALDGMVKEWKTRGGDQTPDYAGERAFHAGIDNQIIRHFSPATGQGFADV